MGSRFFALLWLICSLTITTNSWAKSHTALTELTNLPQLALKSHQMQLPIMLVFSAEWCEYCEVLNEYVYTPMIKSQLYDEKVVLIRHVGVDEPKPITVWSGKTLTKDKWAYELNADLTPTVLFMNAQGKEVAPRIVGISELNLYASLIHQNLNIAYKNMGLAKRIPSTPELLEKQTLNQK